MGEMGRGVEGYREEAGLAGHGWVGPVAQSEEKYVMRGLEHCLPTLSIIMVGAGNMFSADLVFLSSDLSTSRLLGCFSRKVDS